MGGRDIQNRGTPMETQELLRNCHTVVKLARDGVFVSDTEGVVQWANPAAAELLGFERPEDLLGRKAETFYALPSVRARMVREIVEKGRVERYVALLKRRGSDDFWAEFSVTAVLNEQGQCVGIAGIYRDITERVNLTRQVTELTEQNEIILNTISTPIATMDREGEITYVNEAACRLAQQSRDALVGADASDALAWVAGSMKVVKDVMRTGLFRQVRDATFCSGPGEERALDLTILPLRRDGETVGAIVEGNRPVRRASGEGEAT